MTTPIIILTVILIVPLHFPFFYLFPYPFTRPFLHFSHSPPLMVGPILKPFGLLASPSHPPTLLFPSASFHTALSFIMFILLLYQLLYLSSYISLISHLCIYSFINLLIFSSKHNYVIYSIVRILYCTLFRWIVCNKY